VFCLAALAVGCMFGRSPPDTDAGRGHAFADAAPIADAATISDGGVADGGGGGTVLPVRATFVGTQRPRPLPLPLARRTSPAR
jgi:hypothetical protein